MHDTGTRLRSLLVEQSLTVQQLADLTSIELSSVNNVLYGRSKKKQHIAKIAEVLGVTSTYIIGPQINAPFDQINVNLYYQISLIISEVTQQYKISNIEYHAFFGIIHAVYEEALKDRSNLNHLTSFTTGIIKAKIDAMLIELK